MVMLPPGNRPLEGVLQARLQLKRDEIHLSQFRTMLTQEQLTQSLREHLQRHPFVPFRVSLLNGDIFVVDDPKYVAHDGEYKTGGFLAASGAVYFIECGSVIEITPVPPPLRWYPLPP
jgi:hypothetical protein